MLRTLLSSKLLISNFKYKHERRLSRLSKLSSMKILNNLLISHQRGDVVELFPCRSCEEIKEKKPDACSGLYVIMTDGQKLKQASDYTAVC